MDGFEHFSIAIVTLWQNPISPEHQHSYVYMAHIESCPKWYQPARGHIRNKYSNAFKLVRSAEWEISGTLPNTE